MSVYLFKTIIYLFQIIAYIHLFQVITYMCLSQIIINMYLFQIIMYMHKYFFLNVMYQDSAPKLFFFFCSGEEDCMGRTAIWFSGAEAFE